jgi:hypothetical protein
MNAIPDAYLGQIKPRHAREVAASNWSKGRLSKKEIRAAETVRLIGRARPEDESGRLHIVGAVHRRFLPCLQNAI